MTPGTKISFMLYEAREEPHRTERCTRRMQLCVRQGNVVRVKDGLLHFRYRDDKNRRQVGTLAMYKQGVVWCRGWNTPEVAAMQAARML